MGRTVPSDPLNNAAVMSQTFNAVNQAINGGHTSSVSSVIGMIAQGISCPSPQRLQRNGTFKLKVFVTFLESILGDILQKILDSLTLPDMLCLMRGDLNPLQGVHPVVKEHLIHHVLKGDTSSPRIEKLADQISEHMRDAMSEKHLPQVRSLFIL